MCIHSFPIHHYREAIHILEYIINNRQCWITWLKVLICVRSTMSRISGKASSTRTHKHEVAHAFFFFFFFSHHSIWRSGTCWNSSWTNFPSPVSCQSLPRSALRSDHPVNDSKSHRYFNCQIADGKTFRWSSVASRLLSSSSSLSVRSQWQVRWKSVWL